jgi:hypothetical protein
MAEKNVRVRGLTSCSGPWGSLSTREELDLPISVAAPLIGAGFAELVENTTKKKKETATAKQYETPEG